MTKESIHPPDFDARLSELRSRCDYVGSGRNLDPQNWDEFRKTAHAALDDVISLIENIREKPVWQPAPTNVRARFDQPLPQFGRSLDTIVSDVMAYVAPYATGNIHPRFMGWVHGAGTPVGIVAEMLAAGLNMNCGGRDHAGLIVEQQIVKWMAGAVGFPNDASGLFVTGSSMANFLALTIAKIKSVGVKTRHEGLSRGQQTLVAYSSRQSHGCIAQAMELAGLGSNCLRRIETDDDDRINVAVLKSTIAEDREKGLTPFLVVATAGTVNTGAIDPLMHIADLCENEAIWFHVDGAIGALAAFSPKLAPLLAGLERSNSIAFDFHKWGHVPYDAGFLLVRDAALHRLAFESDQAYLQRAGRGLAAGETWPCDLGPDLSRGFRALKVWMAIESFGTQGISEAIEHNCLLATYLAEKIKYSCVLELKSSVTLNIVCFGVRDGRDGSINREIVLDLHEAGTAVPSWTTLRGEIVIRCAIVNHRTTREDIDAIFDQIIGSAAIRMCEPRAA